MKTRREFLKLLAVGSSAVVMRPEWCHALSPIAQAAAPAAKADPWSELPQILIRIKPPIFPNRDFEITKFGARGDGEFDCTESFRKAITACAGAGGGRVIVPAGEF